MLIIIDKRLPETAKKSLKSAVGSQQPESSIQHSASSIGQFDVQWPLTILELETGGIVYEAISGHPDIFFCQTPNKLVISPNLPESLKEILTHAGIDFIAGNHPSGILHPASVHYNAAINDHYLVHRLEYTDTVILENCHYLKKINVSQGYTRCNMAWLKEDHYVTSDEGIYKTLGEHGLKGIFVSPQGILLPGFQNGFIGGCIGVWGNRIFFTGSLSRFPEGEKLRRFMVSLDYEIIELYDGPLVDGGSILPVNNEQ
jgi:hypothetical protein